MIKKWFLLSCFVLQGLSASARYTERFEENEESLGNALAVRRKRGIGSVIVMGTAVLMRTTQLGLTIAQAVTEGCATQPSICTNRDLIEKLDAEIEKKKADFDSTYAANGESFVDLRQASVNNAMISHRTNESVSAVETIDEITQRMIEKLTLKDFPEFAKLAAAIDMNVTSEEYLESVVGQLEYTLESVRDRIATTKHNQLVGIAIQLLTESLLNKFMNSYSSAYGQVAEDLFSGSQIQNMFAENPAPATKVSFMQKVKLMPSVFKQMGRNTYKYFKDGYTSLKKWNRIKSWEGFKGKFKHSMQKPIQKFTAVKSFVSNSAVRRSVIKNFNLQWSQRISAALGIIGDAVSIALNELEWKKVADEMEKAKDNYVEYNKTLTEELAKIKVEEKEIEEGWTNTTLAFKEVSEAIIQLFTDLANHTDFNDVVGLPDLPVNFISAYLPSNFIDIQKANVLSKQQIMIDFLNNMNIEFTQLQDEMSARLTLYSTVEEAVNSSDTIATILDSLKSIYKNQASATIQTFGNLVAEKDVVCTVAHKFPLELKYDFLPLTTFRDTMCNISDSAFSAMETAAQEERNKQIMIVTVNSEVTKNPSLSLADLWSLVKNPYLFSPDPLIKKYGESITEQDVVCVVATQFPAIKTFDYISLTEFRPSCSAVSASGFQALVDRANRVKALSTDVGSAMDICDNYSFCPCISMMVAKSSVPNVTEDDIKAAIKNVRPDKTEYCGTAGGPCDCVNL